MIYLVISGFLWGTGGLTGTLLGRATGLSALAVAAYRLVIGGLLIVAYLLIARRSVARHNRPVTGGRRSASLLIARRKRPVGRKAWVRVMVIGLLAAQFQGCYFMGVSLTSVALATLITIGAAPVIVGVVEGIRGRGSGAAATTVLALSGLALLVGAPGDGFPVTSMLGSAGLALLAASGFAAVTLISARPVPGLDEMTLTGYAFTFGGGLLLAVAATTGRVGFALTPESLGLAAALGAGPTAIAYTVYFRGLRSAPATTGALLALLEPLTGTVLAALILGDRLGVAGIAGAVILALAVVRAVTGARRV